jgi:hypothetical protein
MDNNFDFKVALVQVVKVYGSSIATTFSCTRPAGLAEAQFLGKKCPGLVIIYDIIKLI